MKNGQYSDTVNPGHNMKTQHRKLKRLATWTPPKNQSRTKVLEKERQLLFLIRHTPCYIIAKPCKCLVGAWGEKTKQHMKLSSWLLVHKMCIHIDIWYQEGMVKHFYFILHGDQSWMRKGSAYDKWDMSVVICDTDIP